MKKIICFICAITIITGSACSPKNKTAATATPAVSTSDVSNLQVDAAKTKYPDATLEVLKKGHDIYFGTPCTSCHSAKKITDFSADELPGIIDHMARKAKIADEEKDAVLKYVMGIRLAAKQF